jgi:hypothetical protein
MNAWPVRVSFVVWTALFGLVLWGIGAPPLVIEVPWFVLWLALMLAIGLGGPFLFFAARDAIDRGTRRIGAGTVVHSDPEMLGERYPEVYPPDISYTPARVGPTERLN